MVVKRHLDFLEVEKLVEYFLHQMVIVSEQRRHLSRHLKHL